MKKRTEKRIAILIPWFLVVLCLAGVAISTYCVLDVQKRNQEVLNRNNILLNSQYKLETIIDNQAYTLKIQTCNVQALTNRIIDLIKEKKAIIERATDMRVKNQELQKAVEDLRKEVDYLMEQIQGYRQRIGPNFPC